MNKEQTCYLFFDLDGTVLVKGKLPLENMKAMMAAKRMGHKLILNTGRSRGNTLPINAVFDIPWDGMIFGGGAEIRWKDELMHRQAVSAVDCRKWLSYCLQKKHTIVFGGSHSLLIFDVKDRSETVSDAERDAYFARLDEMLTKEAVTNLTVRGILPDDYPETEMTVIQLPTYADIFPPNCNKGKAILQFCEMTGASLEQCACFGDSQNDLDMFRVCPNSFCMSQAPQELIDLSAYHAKTEFGVAESLNRLFGLDENE